MTVLPGPEAGPAAAAEAGGTPSLALQHAAEGVRDVLGYETVAISMLRETDEFEYVGVVGPPDAVDYLLGTHLAADQLRRQISAAQVTGRVHYVPRGSDVDAGPRWAPDIPTHDDPERWHPDDELFVYLVDGDGVLRGHLAVDGPPGGRVPSIEQRLQLEAYADRILAGVRYADAQRRIDDRLRIAAQARDVVRRAITSFEPIGQFEACAPELVACLRADEVWFRTEAIGRFLSHPQQARPDVVAPVLGILERMSEEAWRTQQAVVVENERVFPESPVSAGSAEVLATLAAADLGSMLLVPVGAGAECLGMVVGVRRAGAAEWSDVEITAAQDLGRDLGSALQTARLVERERGHSAYKQQLIATIAHELKNPLTAVRGNLELLEDELPDAPELRMLTDRLGRATSRLGVLVDNLLTLSAVDDATGSGRRRTVVLGEVVTDAVEVVSLQAGQRGVGIDLDLQPGVAVSGLPGELEHLVVNLLSNAVKYSDADGRVVVRLRREGDDAVLAVADSGIGIATDEVGQVFDEFFRSVDPAARRRPGTGLGLAITARVAERHGGRIGLDSEHGVGSTFTVTLPAVG